MQHILENDQLTVTLAAHGAEVQSVRRPATGQEYIWTADPAVWARHAPVLFPIVGKLRNDEYQLDGQTYRMTQHGFARDQEFKVVEQARHQITFGLTANAKTTQQYPFNFALDIIYRLDDDHLDTTYRVINHDRRKMPFSIGGHPGFLCPAQTDKHWQEYFVQFDQQETLDRHLIRDGLRTGETRSVVEDSQELPLHRALFEDDALVFDNVRSSSVSIIPRSTGQPLVTVEFADFPYLGIWQKVGADFYCIEPWHGWADSTDASGELTEKSGIIVLPPNNQFEASYRIIFH